MVTKNYYRSDGLNAISLFKNYKMALFFLFAFYRLIAAIEPMHTAILPARFAKIPASKIC